MRKQTMSNNSEKQLGSIDAQLDYLLEAENLREVNDFLTKNMAQQRIQALIKGSNLVDVCNSVINLALKNHSNSQENRLIAAAMLGRLSAVARGREPIVFSRISELFYEKPLPIEVLIDGDEKYYASIALAQVKASWLVEYCSEQAVITDTAEKARRALLSIILKEAGTLSEYWKNTSLGFKYLNKISNDDTRFKRIRRISSASNEIVRHWEGEIGIDAGNSLAKWFSLLIRSSKENADHEVLADILDDTLSMLLRVIELRFSNALLAPTYAMMDEARASIGGGLWSRVTNHSKNIEKVRTCLKEAALVLARQGRTDKDIMDVLTSAYFSRAQVIPAITSHFSSAQELEPEIKEWWEKAGKVKVAQRKSSHKIGNTEDYQIGSLLINVEESKTVMDKLERAVVPFLEISDPPLAETVKKAAGSYSEIAIASRQLAAMRKLKHMDIKGAILEYNPMQHEMLGGHRLGVRTIKVERDGIQKDFGGKIKVLVKPRVIPEE